MFSAVGLALRAVPGFLLLDKNNFTDMKSDKVILCYDGDKKRLLHNLSKSKQGNSEKHKNCQSPLPANRNELCFFTSYSFGPPLLCPPSK